MSPQLRDALGPLEVVDLLSRARDRSTVSEAEISSISEAVFAAGDSSPNRNQVIKRFRELDPDAFRGPTRPPKPSGGDGDLRKALLLAERLQSLLEVQSGISGDALDGVRTAAAELRELFAESQQKSA